MFHIWPKGSENGNPWASSLWFGMTMPLLYSGTEADASTENCVSYQGRFCDGSLSATALLLQTQVFYSMLTTFRAFPSKPDLNCQQKLNCWAFNFFPTKIFKNFTRHVCIYAQFALCNLQHYYEYLSVSLDSLDCMMWPETWSSLLYSQEKYSHSLNAYFSISFFSFVKYLELHFLCLVFILDRILKG